MTGIVIKIGSPPVLSATRDTVDVTAVIAADKNNNNC